MEKVTCTCHGGQKIIAERDDKGNLYVQCRHCKQKVKIEIRAPREPKPKKVTALFC